MTISDEQLGFLLQGLHENIEGVKSSAVVSAEGLIVQAILEEGVSDIKLAAMVATMLSVSERVLLELKSGELDVCILQGNEGVVCIMAAGRDLILSVFLDVDARMDLCFIQMRKVAQSIIDIT